MLQASVQPIQLAQPGNSNPRSRSCAKGKGDAGQGATHSLQHQLAHSEGFCITPWDYTLRNDLECFKIAVLGEHEVAQGIKEVHVIHEVPKEPSLNAQWRRS